MGKDSFAINKTQRSIIDAEKTRLIYSSIPTSLLATVAVAICFAVLQWGTVPENNVIVWLFLIMIVTMGRSILVLAFNEINPGSQAIQKWTWYFYIGVAAAGLTWGLGSILLLPENNPEHKLVVAIVLVIMSAGASVSIGIMPQALLLFITPALLPVVPAFFNQGDMLGYAMVVLLLLCFCYFLKSASNLSFKTGENILLRLSSQSREMEKVQEVKSKNFELNRMERVYQTILDNHPDGVVITDNEGLIDFVNKRYCTITGYNSDELLGQPAKDCIPEQLSASDSSGPKQSEKAVTQECANSDGKLYIKHKKGRDIPVEISLSPLSFGDIRYTVFYIHDISYRDANEISLKRYRHIVQNSPDLIVFFDTNHVCQMANSAYLHAMQKEENEVIGKRVEEICPDETVAGFLISNLDNCLAGEVVQNASPLDFPGIGRRQFDVNYYLYQGEISEENGVLVNLHDITEEIEQKEMQENLEKQLIKSQHMEAIGILTAGIAHDFNNILTSMLGYTELTLGYGTIDDESREYLEIIHEGGLRGKGLIEKMLTYSRNEPGEVSLESPKDIIEKAVSLIKPGLGDEVHVEIHETKKLPQVYLEAAEFEQAVINLCLNSRDAMSGRGKIDINLELRKINKECQSCFKIIDGHYLDISIKDSGCGIPEETITKIFDPFHTTKKHGGGTGLGLSMVHGIIHKFGGHIFIDSIVNKGTTIHLLFPLVKKREELLVETPVEDRKKVMVVDDEEMVGSYVRDLLKREDYQILLFTQSEQALRYFQNHHEEIAMVISDQVMPRLTGMELSEEILKLQPEMPIIIMTGYSEEITAKPVKNSGTFEFFNKPLEQDRFLETVNRLTGLNP